MLFMRSFSMFLSEKKEIISSEELTFDRAAYDPRAKKPEGVVSSGISCV